MPELFILLFEEPGRVVSEPQLLLPLVPFVVPDALPEVVPELTEPLVPVPVASVEVPCVLLPLFQVPVALESVPFTDPEVLDCWVLLDVVFLVVVFVRLPEVCACVVAVKAARIMADKKVFFIMLYNLKCCCMALLAKALPNLF